MDGIEYSRLAKYNRLLSYVEHSEEQTFIEPFAEHSCSAMKHWNLLKKRLLFSLSRVLDEPKLDVDKAVSIAVLLHDAGKLTTRYQEYLEETRKNGRAKQIVGFSHEVASIPVLLNCMRQLGFREKINQIAVGAVLFHHEALRQRELRQRVNSLVSPIRNIYRRGVVYFEEHAKLLLEELLEVALQMSVKVYPQFQIDDLRNELVELFRVFDPDNPTDLNRIRLRVSAVQQVICICDNRAAAETRPRKSYPFIEQIQNGGLL